MRRKTRYLVASLSLCTVMVPFTATAADQNAHVKAPERKIYTLGDVIKQQRKIIDTLLQRREAGQIAQEANTDSRSSGVFSSFADNQLLSGIQLSVCHLKLDAHQPLPDAFQRMAPASVMLRLKTTVEY